MMNRKNKQKIIIHFVGIGGIGMSGIAELMIDLGYSVQGSDIVENSNILRLKKTVRNDFGKDPIIGKDLLKIKI